MSSTPEYSSPPEVEPGRRRRAPRRGGHARQTIAVGFMQIVSLIGVIGLAVILGAVMGNVSSWIDGLVIGTVSVVLTILVLFSGRHARRQ